VLQRKVDRACRFVATSECRLDAEQTDFGNFDEIERLAVRQFRIVERQRKVSEPQFVEPFFVANVECVFQDCE
jgi:hypothetical protein